MSLTNGSQQAERPGVLSRTKGQGWSENEHLQFLEGLRVFGKGQWKQISKYYVPSRNPTQVASHAQKHFLRVAAGTSKRRSRFTAVEENARVAAAAQIHSLSHYDALPSHHTVSLSANSAPANFSGSLAPAPYFQFSSISEGGAQQQAPPSIGADGVAVGIPVIPQNIPHRGGEGAQLASLPPFPGVVPSSHPLTATPGMPTSTISADGTKIPLLVTAPGRIMAPMVYESKPRSPAPHQQPVNQTRKHATRHATAPLHSVATRRAQLLKLGELKEKLKPEEQAEEDEAVNQRLNKLRETWAATVEGLTNSAGGVSAASDETDAAHVGLDALVGIAAAIVDDDDTRMDVCM